MKNEKYFQASPLPL